MKKLVIGSIASVAALAVGFSIVAARKVSTVRSNTFIGATSLGGLTKDEAAKQIRVWWLTEKAQPLTLHVTGAPSQPEARTPGALGVTVDDVATANALPMSDLLTDVQGAVGAGGQKINVTPIFKSNGSNLDAFGKEIRDLQPVSKPATVKFDGGAILRSHESPSMAVDLTKLPTAVALALNEKKPVEIPLTLGAKHIADDQLNQISEVVMQFSTRFSSGNRPRCSNIKLASSKLNGVILLPGEKLSFNGTVGRRTEKAGFKLAGVYKNGKHDTGIGGGICQVSTTLYNASLLADLTIRQRSNHSLPVAYVPLGRDATVDYGSLDLIVENSYSTPIAIASHYVPGKLTFTILGKKDPSLSVKIEQANMESWNQETDTIIDRNLRPGAREIVEPGARGHAVSTYRLVFKDGVLVKRESLGRSSYGGQSTVVAINPAPRHVAPKRAPTLPTATPTAPAIVATPAAGG